MATTLLPTLPDPRPDYTAERQRQIDHERMFLEPDAYTQSLPADQKAALDSWLSWSPDPAADTRKSIVRGYLGDFYGLPDEALTDGGYQAYRDRYAREVIGVPYQGGLDDNSFFELVKGQKTKQREFRIQDESFQTAAIADVLKLAPEDPMQAEARMQESAAKIADAGPEDAAKFVQSYRVVRANMEAKAAPVRPLAQAILKDLRDGATDRFSEESQAGIESAIDRLAVLSPEQRGIAVSMMKSEGGQDMTGAVIDKAAYSALRGLTGQLRGFASNIRRNAILDLQRSLSAGDEVRIPNSFANDPDGLRKFVEERTGNRQRLNVPEEKEYTGSRPVTDAEKKKLQELADKALVRSEVAAEAIGILEGTIDPIRSKGFTQKMAINVGSSMGAMVPSFIPAAGFIIQQGAFADSEYQRLRGLGVDPQTANTMGQLSGTVQAGLDRLQAVAALSLPKIPVGRLATSGLAGNAAARATTAIAATQAAEYSIEIAQNGVPILTSMVAERLGWTLPEQAKFEQEWKRWKVVDAETFLTLLPLSMMGGSIQGINDAAVAREYLADPINLRAVGIPAEEADRIASLPEAERPAVYRAAYQRRDPSTPAAAEAQQAVADRVQASKKEAEQAIAEIQDAGLSITRTADGYAVTDTTDGTTLNAPDSTQAMGIARSIMTERGIQKEETFLNALDEFAGFMSQGRTIELTTKSGNLLQELEDAASEGKDATSLAIWERANEFRAGEGDTPLVQDINNPDSRNALEDLMVLGRSSTEVVDNAARSISLIMRGGDALTLVEEQAENDLREAVIAGRTSMETIKGVLQRIEAATGDKYLNTETDTGISEAWSSLVRIYTTATRKGNRITQSGRQETAADLRAIRRRLREAEGNGVTPSAFSKLKEYYAQMKAILGQAARLMKAKAEGKLGDDVEAMIRESLGLKEQDALTNGVIQDVTMEADAAGVKLETPGPGNAITTAERLDAVAKDLGNKVRDPEQRFKMFQAAKERLAGMARAVQFNDEQFKDTKQGTARRNMLRFLQALDTILMPFPAEVRGKVGGFVKLAGLKTNASMEAYLKSRVQKLDEVLETYMRKEYTEAMGRLLKKAEPLKGKPGEKMAGKLGADVQRLMNVVRESLKWTAEEVTDHIAGLDSRLMDGDLTPEAEALIRREIELVQLTGDWNHSDASKRAAALKAATETYEGGYLEWAAKLIAKREKRAGIKTALIVDTGKAGTLAERDERAEKDLGFIGKTKDFFLSLSSLEEVANYVFGRDSKAARDIVDAERTAAYAYEDATAAMGDAVQAHFASLAKGSHLEGEKLRYRLSQKSFTVGGVKLSEMEGIQALLLWNQPDGQRHMIGALDENGKPSGPWHYDQAWVDEVASKLSPEGNATMRFIQQIYGAEWATLNPLYRERHGVDLPQNKNYAPITVAPVQAKGGEMVDPVSGQAVSGSILTPGSLRTRSRTAIAEPQFRDALQTMLAHTAQMEHWKAYYDFAVEAQAVLGNREVSNAVTAAGGKQSSVVLRKWVDYFAQGGIRDAGAALATNKWLSTASGRAARMALVGRIGTLLIQSTQLGAGLVEMPTGAYLSRFGKLMAGRLSWGDALRSDYVQRRIQQMPPIVRQALAGLDTDKPNLIKHTVNRLGTLISGADGLFTAGTYAILLDYHRKQAAAQGFTGPQVDDYAHAQAVRGTERVAQPTRAGTRSLFENTATSPLAKLGWAFASEARQKIALAAWAASAAKANPARAARVAVVVLGVGGLMAAVIRNAWRDARDDDDEEIFDERNWSLKQLIASTISGPLQGIPGLGEAMQSTVAKATGTYDPGGNLLSSLERMIPAVKDLTVGKKDEKTGERIQSWDKDEPVEETIKDVELILNAAGIFNDTAASTTSVMHLIRDGVSILDGLRTDPKEEAAQKKRRESREKREAKKE